MNNKVLDIIKASLTHDFEAWFYSLTKEEQKYHLNWLKKMQKENDDSACTSFIIEI